ncbi:MAG TPA: hypothetical protein VM915_01255 [Verrucomicrobiae bacterium]|nr:hypothetical protein [Verrucomicrobiae bacterium]
MLWTLIVVAIILIVGVIWIIGAREPVFSVKDGEPAWFVAVRTNTAPRFASGVRITWSGAADFALIGAEEGYWTRFYILAGGKAGESPLLPDGEEDALVARISMFTPPSFALGMLRAMCKLGLLPKPKGPVMRNVDALEFRKDIVPTNESIAALLSRPQDYAPTMVNFLAYAPAAKYADSRVSTGAAAYRRYGAVAMKTVYRTGGALMFYGKVLEIMRPAKAGPSVGVWDDVAAMRYPNPSAILSMENVPEYHAALYHRDAGLARTIVIATQPIPDAV